MATKRILSAIIKRYLRWFYAPMALDTLDKAILNVLLKDARQSQVQLAERVVSPAAIARRIKALEQDGVIEGYNLNSIAMPWDCT